MTTATHVTHRAIAQPLTPAKPRYVLYARKSTEQDEKQALSIESQVKEMLAIAEREELEVVEIRREAHSAKDSGQRPVYMELLEDIRRGRFNAIIVWHPDRLSRNAGDLGSLVDLMDQKLLVEIRTYGQTFTNTPSEKFLLMILCSQAKLENDNKSINVKRGLKTRVEMGLWPGRAPTGYLSQKRLDRKCQVVVDPDRAPVIAKMFEKVAYERYSGRRLYNWLKFDLNFKTAAGNKNLTISNIYSILANPFYCGSFEYPKGTGQWYTGQHEPLISKELYDLVQEQVKSTVVRTWGKEFAFTRLMTCGLCQSGVSADEKFKKLKNGTTNRHVYYGCTKQRDPNCKNAYITESELIKQFIELIDSANLDASDMGQVMKREMERFSRFQKMAGLVKEVPEVSSISPQVFAKYLLNEGTVVEKRELLGKMKGRIYLTNKQVGLNVDSSPSRCSPYNK